MRLGSAGNLEEVTEEKRRIEVNWVQSMAGALAAVTSAVLLSTVGVAGTLIGAALGSVLATLGSAVYSFYIRETKDRVSEVSTLAVSRLGRAHARVRQASEKVAAGTPGAERELARADAELQSARVLVDRRADEGPRVDWRRILAGLPWKRITIVAAALFTVAMIVILAFELITGRAISSYTGGSDSHQRISIPGVTSGGGPSPASNPSKSPTVLPSTSGSTTSPTPSPSPSPTSQSTTQPYSTGPSTSSSPSSSAPSPTPAPGSAVTPVPSAVP